MANTTFKEIYFPFLGNIKAYDLMELAEELQEEMMDQYLIKAATNFSSCEKMKLINKEDKCFEAELDDDEIDVIAAMMVTYWLRPLLLSDELLQTHLGTKEYTEASQNKLIEQVRETFKMAKSEARQAANTYDHKHHKIRNLNKRS